MLEDDKIFLNELKTGHKWQLWAGLQFLREGFVVQVPVLRVRPDRSDIDQYTDHGDIYVARKMPDWLRFECKSRRLRFNSRDDYPFNTALVDRVQTWKRKLRSKPAAILLVSQVTGAILTIGAWTEDNWRVEEKHDSVRNYDRTYYVVERKHLINWEELLAFLRGKILALEER